MFTHHLRSAGRSIVIVHGGTSSPRHLDDGCRSAARQGHDADGALEMAVAAVAALEDDGRYNAGSGALTAADGITIEMDAAVMDSRDRLGAVAAVRNVRNPVRVAREVAGTPHWLLVGEGALRFARTIGLVQPHVRSTRAPQREAAAADLGRIARFWNFATPIPRATTRPPATDTVGAVVRDHSGNFAAAASTGGLSGKLLGRVGDTAAVGCGFYAGPAGAFAATGIGERIVRAQLAFRLHAWVESGMALVDALQRALAMFPDDVDVGVIGVSRDAACVCANRDMAFAIEES
jgi:L-asparaginase/beta-aspartyl-peptidase (threonine type)